MKKIPAVLSLTLTLFVCTTLQAQKAKWKEMDDFHTVMAQTFHPAEEGKFDPIKKRSGEMIEKAVAWQNSTAPEGYDKKAVKKSLKSLVKGSKELDKLIKENAADTVLKEKLSALHDTFHEIMEKCEGEHQH